MIKQEDVYRIGRLGKPHGVKGEVSLQFSDDVFDRVEAEYLVLETEGILVPFFMEEYRFRSAGTALVKFCDVDTQEQAARLTGSSVYFPRSLSDDGGENLSWAGIVGYSLVDAATGATVGRIAAVDDTTANVLFELEGGKLIPASEELITTVDKEGRIIEIELPEGLLAL